MNTLPCVSYPHYAHDDCPGVEQPPARDLNGGDIYYLDFYHEVNNRYGVSLDDPDVVAIFDGDHGLKVHFTDGTVESVEWDCVREYSDR